MKSISVKNIQNPPKVKQPIRFVWQLCVISFVIFNGNKLQSQAILNGSFEINAAPTGIDKTNISNSVFNNLMPYCYSFGNFGIDLITTDTWSGLAQQGNWYIGIGALENEIDMFSMELSDTLIIGNSYQLTFYINSATI